MIRSLSLTGEPIAVTGRRTAALTSGRIDGGAAARKIQFSDALSRMTADVDEFFFVVFVFFFSVFFVFFCRSCQPPHSSQRSSPRSHSTLFPLDGSAGDGAICEGPRPVGCRVRLAGRLVGGPCDGCLKRNLFVVVARVCVCARARVSAF